MVAHNPEKWRHDADLSDIYHHNITPTTTTLFNAIFWIEMIWKQQKKIPMWTVKTWSLVCSPVTRLHKEIRASEVMLRDVGITADDDESDPELTSLFILLLWFKCDRAGPPLDIFISNKGLSGTHLFVSFSTEHIISQSRRKKNRISNSHGALCALDPWQHLQYGVKPEYFVTILIIPRNCIHGVSGPGNKGRGWSRTREYDRIRQKLGRRLGSGEGEDWALDNEYYKRLTILTLTIIFTIFENLC